MTIEYEIPFNNYLAAMEVAESPLRRGASNVSMTHVKEGAKASILVSRFKDMLDQLRNKPVGHGFDPDSIDAKRLALIVREKVQAIPEFVDYETSKLSDKYVFVRQLSSGRASRSLRLLVELAESVVKGEFSTVRSGLMRTVGNNPFAAGLIAENAEDIAEDLLVPDFDRSPVSRLANVVRVQRQLVDDPTSLPEPHREAVAEVLRQRGHQLADEAMVAVCQDQVAAFLGHSLNSLRRLIKEIRSAGGQFNQNVADVRQLLEQQRRDAKHRDAANKSGIEIDLDGPDEASLTAAMLQQEGLADIDDLTASHFEMLQVRLSKIAKEKYPALNEQAAIGELLTRISPIDIVEQLTEVVEQSIGTRHTVYSALRGIDPREFARTLLQRSSVLVQLGGYRHQRLHIQPIDQVLVRFPKRIGDDDEQVYKDICEALFERFPGVLLFDAGQHERDIKCVRTLVGFPFGVDVMNPCFLKAYCDCDPHPPHLYGIFSEDGQPLPEIRKLNQLRTSTKPEDK